MDFEKEVKLAEKEITIIGALNLGIDLNDFAQDFLDLLDKNEESSLNILYEFDNQLFSYSLCTDTYYSDPRRSFTDLRFERDLILSLKDSILHRGGYFAEDEIDEIAEKIDKNQSTDGIDMEKYNKSKQISDRIAISQMHLPISLDIAKFDDRIYILPTLDRIKVAGPYKELSENDPWLPGIRDYIDNYFDPLRAGKYSSRNGAEIIELYDANKAPRGIFPRNCFYDTDYHQFVVWDFIFDRQGNLLIHKRAENAKDNRGMWDKSVGGHVDWEVEKWKEHLSHHQNTLYCLDYYK